MQGYCDKVKWFWLNDRFYLSIADGYLHFRRDIYSEMMGHVVLTNKTVIKDKGRSSLELANILQKFDKIGSNATTLVLKFDAANIRGEWRKAIEEALQSRRRLDEVQSTPTDVFRKCGDLERYLAGYLNDPIMKKEFKACFDSDVDSIFLKYPENLKDYVAGSQNLLDAAASFLDDPTFEENFRACFDFVFDCFFTKAFSVVIDHCKKIKDECHWGQDEFIILATWASNFEGRVLNYDKSKLEMFNVDHQNCFVDLMIVYSKAESKEISRLISNLISLDIRAESEPLQLIEGQLRSGSVVELMTIYNQSLSRVIGTGNALIVTSLMKYILPVLESFPKTYLEMMHARSSSLPIEHVVSVLNGFYEAFHWINTLEDELSQYFGQKRVLKRASGVFDRAWKEGSRIVAHVMAADVHPLIQNVGDESWLNGSVTADWQATVSDYFGDLRRWMVPDVLRKLSADTFDDNLRCYINALLSANINIDQTFVDRTYKDLNVIQDIFLKYADIDVVNARIQLMIGFVEMLACEYDDMRRHFMSLAKSTNIDVGILEKVTSSLFTGFVGFSNASADT